MAAEIRLSQLPSGEPERITNEFLGMFLQDSERQSLQKAIEIMSGDSPIKRVFYALDKLDPIVAVWRYLHTFRRDARFPIDEFLDRMRHFFENPQVKVAVSSNLADPRIVALVDQLQKPEKSNGSA